MKGNGCSHRARPEFVRQQLCFVGSAPQTFDIDLLLWMMLRYFYLITKHEEVKVCGDSNNQELVINGL